MINNGNFSRFIWALCILAILFSTIGLGLELSQTGGTRSLASLANTLTLQIFMIVAGVIGSLIVTRQPRNMIGWLLLFFPLVGSFSVVIDRLARIALASTPQNALPMLFIMWVSNWLWWLLIGPVLLIPLLFPTGKPPSPRWNALIAGIGLAFAFFVWIITFSVALRDDELGVQVANPIGFLSAPTVERLMVVFLIMLFSVAVASLASIFVRFRRATGIEREQIKWFLYASTIFVVVYMSLFYKDASENDWAGALFNLTLTGIPVAIGAAILRYRLWDIDLLIRRTLTYTLLTGLMAILYFGGVTLLQRLFTLASGQQSPAATLISTLLIAGLFTPVRRALQNAIDRRFNRKKYDTQKIIDEFVNSARSQTDLTTLSEELVQITQQALEPEKIDLWIRQNRTD